MQQTKAIRNKKREREMKKELASCLLDCIPLPGEGLRAPGPTNWQAPQKESHDVDSSYTNDSMCDIKPK